MSTQQCTYRGVSYAPTQDAQVSDATVELHYRGSVYHHRQQAFQEQVNR